MAGNILPWLLTILVLGIFLLGVKLRLISSFPMFYSYLACVLVSDLARFLCRMLARSFYLPVYWYTQFACVALGFGIIWEVYGLIFKSYPGTARMARFLVSAALVVVFLNALVEVIMWHPSMFGSVANLEKNMRIVQAILLALGMALVSYYEIPIGRNVTGLLFGYGWYVSAGVLLLVAREYWGREFYSIWATGQTAAYLLTLLTWLYTMRAYHPVPAADLNLAGELDFPFRARTTRQSLARIKSSLGKAMQP